MVKSVLTDSPLNGGQLLVKQWLWRMEDGQRHLHSFVEFSFCEVIFALNVRSPFRVFQVSGGCEGEGHVAQRKLQLLSSFTRIAKEMYDGTWDNRRFVNVPQWDWRCIEKECLCFYGFA